MVGEEPEHQIIDEDKGMGGDGGEVSKTSRGCHEDCSGSQKLNHI